MKRMIHRAGFLAAFLTVFATQSFAQTRVSLHTSSGSCSKCDLSGKDMPGMTLRNANFSGSSFSRSNLSGGRIFTSDLSGTHFKKAFLVRVEGDRVNLAKADMQDVTLMEAKFNRSVMTGADLRRADLTRGEFVASNFENADLSSASLSEVNFQDSHFTGARFDHANLQGAKLDRAVLKNAQFGNAVLKNVTFTGANISGANMSQVGGLEQSQLDGVCGSPDTQLPFGLTVAYCIEALSAENMPQKHDHGGQRFVKDKAALHLDRAVSNLETLMREGSSSNAQFNRRLQSVHADLVSARREIEK